MRKLILSLAMIAATTTTASYGFGLPKIPGVPAALGGGGSSAVSGDSVEKFITIGQESAALINSARVNLALALSTKEDRAKIAQQQAQIKAGLDAKDQKAKDQQKEFQSSLDATLKANIESGAAEKQLSTMSQEQLKLVLGSVLQLGYGIILQKEQIPAGQNMISAISSNPMLATKLPAIKDVLSTMTGNIAGAGGYLLKLPTLLKSANIAVTLPTDSSSKPAQVSTEDMMALLNEPAPNK